MFAGPHLYEEQLNQTAPQRFFEELLFEIFYWIKFELGDGVAQAV
jgi:hypothetical protein